MREATEALIVVDLQLDFCPGGALAVQGGDEIVAEINQLMTEFQTVILTQDWHPGDHSSFASNHPGANAYDVAEMDYGAQVLWPDHCIIDSPGARFHPELNSDAAQLVVRKGFRPEIDSYSAFFENDRRTATGLEAYLAERGIETVTLVGLALDYCVAYSALDAVRLGFKTVIREDLCRAINLNGSLEEAKTQLDDAGVVTLAR